MANNPYVNKVIYGDDTVMDISDTTAEEEDVISGKTFYKASGERSTGSAVIPDISNCYQTTDTSWTSINDNDYIPMYSTGTSAKRKITFSNFKTKLKPFLNLLYAKYSGVENLIKKTVGWVNKNYFDTSEVELGVRGSGTSDPNYARIVFPRENKSYCITISGTNVFESIQYYDSDSVNPGVVAGWSNIISPQTIAPSAKPYLIIQFVKSSTVTLSDIVNLQMMLLDYNMYSSEIDDGSVAYEPYHPSVEELLPDMISNNNAISTITAKSADNTDSTVASSYAIGNWSNAEIITLVAHMNSGDDTVGTWEESPLDWKTTGVRTGWIWHSCLYNIVADNEVEISVDFDVAGEEVVGLYAYRIDDNVTQTIGGETVNGGAIAIKLTSPIQNASGVNVAVNLKRQRTNKVNATIIS